MDFMEMVFDSAFNALVNTLRKKGFKNEKELIALDAKCVLIKQSFCIHGAKFIN